MGKYLRKCEGIGEIAVMEISPFGVRTRDRSSRIRTHAPENLISPEKSVNPVRIPADRSSSNGSSGITHERLRSEDLEGFENVDLNCRERRDIIPSESDDRESTARISEGNSRLKSTADKMLSEIEEFFSAAERDEKKRFAENYNFDVEKEVPLEGRYEWVRLK